MAHTDSLPQSSASEAEAEAPAQSRTGRRDVRLLAIGVAAFLVLAAVVAWNRVAMHRLDQVTVAWAGPPDCRGAEVIGKAAGTPASGPDRWGAPIIAAQRGMRCSLLVEVRNDGGGTVNVEDAVMPFMGLSSEMVLKVDTRNHRAAYTSEATDDVDLTRLLGARLEPGQSYTFEVPLVFRERGCSGGVNSGGMSVSDFPTVSVSYLMHTSERAPLEDLRHVQAGPARGCDSNVN